MDFETIKNNAVNAFRQLSVLRVIVTSPNEKVADVPALYALAALLLAPWVCAAALVLGFLFKYGIRFVRVISPFYCVMIVYQIYAGALRGAGIVRMPVIIMLLSFVAFRQAYLFTVSRVNNIPGLMAFGYPVGWILCSVMMTICYFSSPLGRKNKPAAAE